MASLQSRSPIRSAHPLIIINKLLSLIVFTVLLGTGWVAVSYIKSQLTSSSQPSDSTSSSAAESQEKTVRIDQNRAPEVKRLSAPVRLVYSCAEDKEHYHLSTHLPSRCERNALSEEAALKRNLKPCSVCIPR